MSTVHIRPETPVDEAAITAVTEAAFLQAEHSSHTEQFIVKALRRAGQLSVSLVALRDGQLVGHVAVSPVQVLPAQVLPAGPGQDPQAQPASPSQACDVAHALAHGPGDQAQLSPADGRAGWLGLGPISVLPAHWGQGVGSALMNAALAALQAQGAAGCVLLGDPQFYARFGFRALPQLWLADVPPVYFQALHWQGPLPAGEVRYHAAFSATA